MEDLKFENVPVLPGDEMEDPETAERRRQEREVTHPFHYMQGGVDVLEFASYHTPLDQQIGFARINVLKYVSRYDKKNGMDDLLKAQRYLEELIKLEGKR